MITASIDYRTYSHKDIPQIISLWEKNSDFGGLNEKQFESWFLKTPYEKVEIIVAEDSDKQLIGQMIFMPTRMIVDGKTIKVMKIAAPILDKNFRFRDVSDHPLFNMFMKGINQAKTLGFSLIYFFPARGWLRAIEMYSDVIKWQTAAYDTFSIDLKTISDDNVESRIFKFQKSETINEEYDQLWEQAVSGLPVKCGIVRKKEWLRYRLGEHCVIEARDASNGLLKGYIAVKKTGLLVDMLAASLQDLKKIFWGSVEELATINNKNKIIETGKITGMFTPLMSSILIDKEVEFPKYKFEFACCSLDDSIDDEQIKAERWHMMPDV